MGLFHKTVDQRNKQYAIVPDKSELSKKISAFRKSYNDYFQTAGLEENCEIQRFVTQPFWHMLSLQKAKMYEHGITMETRCDRRDYLKIGSKGGIREDRFPDGRYAVNNVFEDITATKTFYRQGKPVGEFEFEEAANYVLFAAKTVGGHKVMCPNCGAEATRENLIDGCDFCGTRFTIEDLDGRIGHFAFQDEYEVKWSKYGAAKADKAPLNKYEVMKHHNDRFGEEIREKDGYFSLFELYSNIRNKVAAIYLASNPSEINAFSEIDLRPVLERNKDAIYLQIYDVHVKNYEIRGTFQYVDVYCALDVYEWKNNKIEKRLDIIFMKLMKVERNKTKEVNAPKIMKCRGCGVSVTLIDGKTCPMCGREIDLIKYDWVIVEYRN